MSAPVLSSHVSGALWVCKKCGSPELLRDAYVAMNDPLDVRVFEDSYICDPCGENHGREKREVTA